MKKTTKRHEEENIMVYGLPKGTIELQPHPEEIIDVDSEILKNMTARLRRGSCKK